MNEDEARSYLIGVSKIKYHKYIEIELAGDLAIELAGKMAMLESGLMDCNKIAVNSKDCHTERINPQIALQSSVPLFALRGIIICKKCGNKRCPHATDENFECTNSNERGQKGSKYV